MNVLNHCRLTLLYQFKMFGRGGNRNLKLVWQVGGWLSRSGLSCAPANWLQVAPSCKLVEWKEVDVARLVLLFNVTVDISGASAMGGYWYEMGVHIKILLDLFWFWN
jgi:hypothetical protein